jgi:hypothetical protein
MQKIIYLVCLLLVVVSCHLDEPTKPDTEEPFGELKGIIADEDTLVWKKGESLINYETSLPYLSDEIIITDAVDTYHWYSNINDDVELYKAAFNAKYEDKTIVLKEFEPESGIAKYSMKFIDLAELSFPDSGTFDVDYKLVLSDEAENSKEYTLPKFKTGIYTELPSHMDLFQLDVPNLFRVEIEGDQLVKREVLNNFSGYEDKLIFMQFHGNMCPNCMLEGKHLQELYESPEYNPDEIYISTFFSSPIEYNTFMPYIKNFLTNGIQGVVPHYDHYFDGEEGSYAQEVKNYYNLTQNDVIAIFPDGDIDIFELGTDFEAWIHEMLEKYEAMK